MPDTGKRKVKIFYSWQSDRGDACCKRFIRIAAGAAAAAVGTKLDIEIIIDADTEGVAGTPPITDTILRKIDDCDLFLADMTFVGETAGAKLLPNPNVMGEYGYALRSKGAHRILLVMNTAFGPPDSLPFDLRHMRHPAQFSLTEGAPETERRSTRKRFAATMEGDIEIAVHELLAASVTASGEDWSTAETELQMLHVQPFSTPVPVIVSGPKILVSIVPLASLHSPYISPAAVKSARSHFPPSLCDKIDEGADELHWWTSGPLWRMPNKPNPETDWLFRLTSGGLFQIQTTIGHRRGDDPEIVVYGEDIERHLVSAVDRAAHVAQIVGISGPALIAASLEQIEGVVIHRPQGRKKRLRKQSASMGTVQLEKLEAPTADRLRRLMDRMWLIGGWEDGSPSFVDARWAGYAKK
jgi:hypothetical protein